MGVLVAAVPLMSPVAAADSCGDSFGEKVTCGSAVISKGAVVITLDRPLEYRKLSEAQRASLENLRKDTNPLVVQVPKGMSTGEGGTALLLMADGRLVDPDATIDPLGPDALTVLTDAGVCENKELCDSVNSGPTGKQFIDKGFAADYSTHVLAIDSVDTDPTTKSPGSSNSDDKNSKGGQGKGGKGDTAQAGGGDTEAAGDSTSWAALWMGLLLVLLLLAFAVVIRRSRGPVAVGHRTASGRLAAMPPGGGARRRERGEPRPADGRSPTHGAARGGDGRAPTQAAHDGDESTTRLRVAPTARHGRQVSARPAHTRTAVVRTELHPQGYVELDRVLYRAVWAEAGR
ncbi:hypothetical protein, partial [Streptomyces torulosus]|uniref:hypothetical protein n=1 Tax=Streptomyces torulosus TaxID=68276 RepID=UPI0006EBC258